MFGKFINISKIIDNIKKLIAKGYSIGSVVEDGAFGQRIYDADGIIGEKF